VLTAAPGRGGGTGSPMSDRSYDPEHPPLDEGVPSAGDLGDLFPPEAPSEFWPSDLAPIPRGSSSYKRRQRAQRDREATPPRGTEPTQASFLRELPVLLLVAFLLAFVLRTFVLQVFFIPSSSMEETLQIDDRMVVEKLTYRFREPRRGEVVVFEGDDFAVIEPAPGAGQRVVRGLGQFLGVVPANARDFVKRVIGLPGDEILIEGGMVSVNGVVLDEPYVVHDDLSDFGPIVVPEGRLFFLGDNRPNSSDSRRSLGMVPRDHVVGRSVLIIWPPDHAGLLTGTEHEVPDPPLG
jgi:signal peptidase I